MQRPVIGMQARWRFGQVVGTHSEQLTTAGELALALAIAEEPEVANAMKPIRQDTA